MPNILEKALAVVIPSKEAAPNSTDPIPTGATNLTLTSAFIAAIGLVVDQFAHWSDNLIGKDASSGTKAALSIAIIAALAILFAADVLARGYASAHLDRTPAATAAATSASAASALSLVSIPSLPSDDEHGWQIVKVEGDQALVLKKGKAPQWRSVGELVGE